MPGSLETYRKRLVSYNLISYNYVQKQNSKEIFKK